MWLGDDNLEPDDATLVPIEQPTKIATQPLSGKDQDDRVRMALGLTHDDPPPEISVETLQDHCKRRKIEFTRSRPYRKNDQARIERKNGPVIRRFVGSRRSAGLIAGQCLARVYRMIRSYVNYSRSSTNRGIHE